jgi:hypothetical protein
MTIRLVVAPNAPSHDSANGACPPECLNGWKWSLTKTESNPHCSARQAKRRRLDGSNCSAEAL